MKWCRCGALLVFQLNNLKGTSTSSGILLRTFSLKPALKELPEEIPEQVPQSHHSRKILELPFVYYRPTDYVYIIQKKKQAGNSAISTSSIARNVDSSEPVTVADFRLLGTDLDVGEWKQRKVKLKDIPSLYANLAKARLTLLVVSTAVTGYAIAPDPLLLGTLALCTAGTGLLSASANATNQFLEVPYDSQMKRTQARVLVKGLLTPLHAAGFAATCGVLGFSILYLGVNQLTAFLGLANAVLYFGVYTPMKRVHIGCTWLGAVVGAIPPLMGWAACCNCLGPGAWTLAGILYAWQFPHFNGLSWNVRPEYSRAGYRVMCVTNPGLCRRTTLRYSVALLALCSLAAPLSNLTNWTFAVDSVPLNLYLIFLAHRFYRKPDSQTSRKLFRYTLVYLPALMMLMLISKHQSKE